MDAPWERLRPAFRAVAILAGTGGAARVLGAAWLLVQGSAPLGALVFGLDGLLLLGLAASAVLETPEAVVWTRRLAIAGVLASVGWTALLLLLAAFAWGTREHPGGLFGDLSGWACPFAGLAAWCAVTGAACVVASARASEGPVRAWVARARVFGADDPDR